MHAAWAGDTCEGSYNSSGKKEGIWLCKKDGKIYRKERYKKGELLTYMLYNEKGQLIETRNKKGKVRKYNPCGC
jgi:hypothetical protein